MKLLTRDAYDQRFAELTRAREDAESEFRRANLAAEMGVGGDADIRKAKQALDLADGRLEGLESAWTETKRLTEIETKERRKAAHRELVTEVEGLLTQREDAAAAIDALAARLQEKLSHYDDLSRQLTGAGSKFRPHIDGLKARDERVSKLWWGFTSSVQRTVPLRPLVLAVIDNDRLALADGNIPATEECCSAQVRLAAERLSLESVTA